MNGDISGWPLKDCFVFSMAVMHDSDYGIGIDSGMIPLLTGNGIGIGISVEVCPNLYNQTFATFLLELESQSESEAFRVSLESESRQRRNRASLFHGIVHVGKCAVIY